MQNKLTVVIVTFNSSRHIEQCIDSIFRSRVIKSLINVVIIDNASKDKTVEVLRKIQKKYRKVAVVINENNLGFARAVNQGIRMSIKSKYLLLLNPDTILFKDSIPEILNCVEKNECGICGGQTIDESGKKSGCYFRFPNLQIGLFDFTNFRKLAINDKWHKYFYYADSIQRGDCFNVDVVTGGFMLITNNTIKKIGLLDESYFMYLEDVDYCLRAKNNHITVCHSETSKVIHKGGASSNNKDRIKHSAWLASRKIYFLKHFNFLINLAIQPIFLIDDLLILVKKSLHEENLTH